MSDVLLEVPAPTPTTLPALIQGGMGIGVSGWRLARAVSLTGALGVVSATALDSVLARQLQDGDEGGHLRRALAAFPVQEAAQWALDRYFLEGGRAPDQPYRAVPMHLGLGSRDSRRLTVLACYAEVFLAREGHSGLVGINLLTKLQCQTLPSLYGAMLAGVNVVLMGAGIPTEIPGVLDAFSRGAAARLRLDVRADNRTGGSDTASSNSGSGAVLTLDPAEFGLAGQPLGRPAFLPIVASNVLAEVLHRKAAGGLQGFIVEGPTAGGHNAPPRGPLRLDEQGQPIYGPRDVVSLPALRSLGLPFWLAGGSGTPAALRAAQAEGAAGVQVGTLFAYCDESGLDAALKAQVLNQTLGGSPAPAVHTDAQASPTGFPFKVVELNGSLSDPEQYQARKRVCDLGYLREAYRTQSGGLAFRCPAEPVASYVAKGGKLADTVGRKCLCNALLADIGLGQVRAGQVELGLLTSGDDLRGVQALLQGRDHYSAAETVAYLRDESL
jgi:NAD(P)H-dependent flavin oxidoreductase YrpB (nitropropane dioxygenase family)